MSMEMHIKSSERGVVRVFHIDLPRAAIDRFTTQAGTGEWPLQYALGATSLRNAFVEVIDLRELGSMSLSDYLSQAHDVGAQELAEMRTQLDGLRGHVLVLSSQAFDQTEQTLTISSPVRWIGTFNEPKPAGRGPAVRSTSAKGAVGQTAAAPASSGPNPFWFVVGAFFLIAFSVVAARFLI